MREWGLRSLGHSMLYHGSLLIPRIVITYVFIELLFPFSLKKLPRIAVRFLLYLVYLAIGLVLYRIFLNLISWPLIMNHSPDFYVFDHVLSAYSFLKVITPLSLLFGVISVVKSYQIRLQNEALEKEKYKAELKYLRAQINPHFLFNTLNSLYVLALDKSEYTPKAIAKLSSLFRYVLKNSLEEYVRLDIEMKILRDYVDLEQLRYSEKLNLEFKMEVINGNCLIPSLILLPFVENVFKHGVSEAVDDIFAMVHLKQRKEYVELYCENTFDSVCMAKTNESGQGIQNVLQRLELIYKDQYHYQQQILENRYCVTMRIPVLNITTDLRFK